MPIYQYRCNKCAKVFEKIRPLHHIDEPVECDECGEYGWHDKKISLSHFYFDGCMPSYEKEARESEGI